MLPATQTHRFRLAEVLENCLAAVTGQASSLGIRPARTAIVVLVDGLGTAALRERSGHARTLSARLAQDGSARAPFPTTTAAGIATLTTGADPGTHGMVGYTVIDAANDRVVNELSGWDDRLDPATWQRVHTVFERASASGVGAYAIGPARFRGSGFSRAVLRGAEYIDANSLEDRVDRALAITSAAESAIGYLYVPELDSIAHKHGLASGEWTDALESLDSAIARLAAGLGHPDAVLVTADHGAVDIPEHGQVIAEPSLFDGVRHIAGEPRCLQLGLEPGVDPDAVAARWAESYGDVAWVATRAEATAAGLFGAVDPVVTPRIGDVPVAARTRVAFYSDENDSGRGMVGQHGSLSQEETTVPLLRFGAAAS